MNSYQLRVAMAGDDDQWQRDIEDAIDGMPETLDFCTPECAGQMDAEEGMNCDPTRHGFRTVLECEAYIIAWKDTVALEEQVEGRLDAEWHMRGNW